MRLGIPLGAIVAVALLLGPETARADCASADAPSWPSFRTVVPGASTVLVGQVTDALNVERGSGAISRFRLRVLEVLRAVPATEIEFQKAAGVKGQAV